MNSRTDQIFAYLRPPSFANDENTTLIARIVHYATLCTFVTLFFVGIYTFLLTTPSLPGLLLIAGELGVIGAARWQLQRGDVRRASVTLVAFGWTVVALFVFFSGGLGAISGILYLSMIPMTVMLLGWKAGIIAAVLLQVYVFVLELVEAAGYPLPRLIVLDDVSSWLLVIYATVQVLIVVVITEFDLRANLHVTTKQLAERERAEAALRANEERFRIITSVISDYTFARSIDAQGVSKYSMLSGAFESITGYTPQEFEERGGWPAILHPDDVAQEASNMAHLHENQRVETEVRIIRKDGEIRWVHVFAQPVWDVERQQLVGVNGAVQDITERRRSEIALQESQEHTLRFHDYLKAMHTAALDLNRTEKLDDFFRMAVEKGRSHLGFDRMGLWLFDRETMTENGTYGTDDFGETTDERHLQKPVTEFTGYERILSGEQQSLLHNLGSAVSGVAAGAGWVAQAALWDGEQVIGYLSADNLIHYKPLQSYQSELLALYGATLGTMYKQKLSEIALRESEKNTRNFQERLKGLHEIGIVLDGAESVDDMWRMAVEMGRSHLQFDRMGIWLYDPEAQIAHGTFGTGQNGETLDERGLVVAIADYGRNPDDSESFGVIDGIVSGEQQVVLHHDVPIMAVDGGVVGLGWSMQAVLWDGKRPVGHLSTDNLINQRPLAPYQMDLLLLYGITLGHIYRRKIAEGALRQSEKQLRALLDATTDMAFLMAADGTFLTVNKRMTESLKCGTQEFFGANVFAMLNSETQGERRTLFDEVLMSKKSVRWVDSNAATWWDNSLYPILAPSGDVEAFAMYSRDISEQKRLEAELQRYTAQLEQMVEERTAELRRAKDQIEVILNNTSDALALAQPDGDIQTSNPAYTSTFDGETIERILGLITSESQVASVGDALFKVIYGNETRRVEAQITGRDGGADRDIDLALIPVRITDDDVRSGILVSARDITHMKEIERFKTRFVENAVHDLATPISGLTLRLYLLKRAPERLEEHVRALENQVGLLSNLLDDLRTLSRLDRDQVTLDGESCDVNQLVKRIFDTYEPVALDKRQRIEFIADANVPMLRLDARQFERVIANLISNAINYTPDEKEIVVQTAVEGSEVVFSVKDQGIGIDAEDLPHVFDRFFRTTTARKTRSSGTGLGLAIVKEVVEMHGGRVSVESEPGQGSTFSVRLPVGETGE